MPAIRPRLPDKPKSCIPEEQRMSDDITTRLEDGRALLMEDICKVLRTSERNVRRKLAAGTFPIRPLPGVDKKFRWSPLHVRRFLETGRKVG